MAWIPLFCVIMHSPIQYEEALNPESTLPVQFQRLWHGPKVLSAERRLALSILWQAADDLQKYRCARRHRRQRLYMDAYRWVASDDRSWAFSFVNLCEVFNLSPEALRGELLGDATSAKQAA